MFNRLLTGRDIPVLKPPTPAEQELIEELRRKFQELKYEETTNCPESEDAWKRNVYDLSELVLAGDPREFLCWDVISETMFVKNDRYILTELNELRRRADWDTVWRKAIREVPIGKPMPFNKYPDSSGNLIHHGYHLSQFEEKVGVQPNVRDFVLEFGGGYGCMCRLFYNMGFRGKYILYDFPQFTALQEYYLKSIGIPVHTFDELPSADNGVICISDISTLKKLLTQYTDKERSLFIAMWSISETPLNLRKEILSLVTDFDAYLMAYQDGFGEMDNVSYFRQFKGLYENDIDWVHWSIEHLPGNHYFVGTRRQKYCQDREIDRGTNLGFGLKGIAKERRTAKAHVKGMKVGYEFPAGALNSIARFKKMMWNLIQDYRLKKGYEKWVESGKPIPPPHVVKQMTVKEFARRYEINAFIETGTYLGDMVGAVKNSFQRVYSIELSFELCRKAERKFAKYSHVTIVEGDSSKVLPQLLNGVEERCLFWLDGHYSEGITARGDKETPILEELRAIVDHPIKDHVILIDDARCFTGMNEYPTIEAIRALILSRYPDYVFRVENDIIRAHIDRKLVVDSFQSTC